MMLGLTPGMAGQSVGPEMTDEAAMAEASALGAQEQRAMDDVFAMSSPKGRFTVNGLNNLVDAFNDVLTAVGIPDPYPEFQSGQRVLPGEFVRGLAMVADMAEQAGVPNPVKLDAVADDTDLNLLAAKLQKLAVDEKFVTTVTGGPAEMPAAPEEGGEVADTEPGVNAEDDALFMQRM